MIRTARLLLIPAACAVFGGCASGGILVTGSAGVASSSDPTKLSVCVFPATGARGSGFERSLIGAFHHYAQRGGIAWKPTSGPLFRSVETVLSLEDARNCDISVKIEHPGMTILKPAIVDVYSSRTKENVLHFEVVEAQRAQDLASPIANAFAKGGRLYQDVMARRPAADRPSGENLTAGAVSKDDIKRALREAMAEEPARNEIKSDVDQPAYHISQNPDAFAVVVGVEKYNALPEARFAERDAKAVNEHLLAMGYPQRNVVLLTGAQATRTGLVKNLEAWLPNQVTERSTVFFYFSGHGAPDAKTSQAYLVPMDGDPQYLEETAYPIQRLYGKLAALKAKRVLVALDSCFSGAGGRSVLAQGTRPLVAKLKLAPAEGKVVSLAASSAEEITGALEEQGHGLFTYHLLKALTETAGRGSVAEIYAALKPRVQDEARRQNRAQTPQAFGAALDAGLR